VVIEIEVIPSPSAGLYLLSAVTACSYIDWTISDLSLLDYFSERSKEGELH